MKKLAVTVVSIMTLGVVNAQEKGKFEVYDFDNFKLHVYYTNDALGDASYIVEGDNGLVTMETPLFKDNVTEFNTYLAQLGKPVEKEISDYHLGAQSEDEITMPEGMPTFMKGPVYSGMMQGFAKNFGDAIVETHTGMTSEVAFGSTQTWAGISFVFSHGATTDFPGASILIGKKVYYTHWTPSQSHANSLQISSTDAIDAELVEAQNALKSGAELFIGGHGGAAEADAVKFKIEYLNTVKTLLSTNKTAEAFITALKAAYPNLPGEDGLEALANALYK